MLALVPTGPVPGRDSKEENLDIHEVKKLIMQMTPYLSIPHPPRFFNDPDRCRGRG
jgi:hypothetical protein